MPTIHTAPLGQEGAIKFVLTPMSNGMERIYLIDFGSVPRNRITLLVKKDPLSGHKLALEVIGAESDVVHEDVKPFPQFQLGVALDIELTWSSTEHRVAVFIGEGEEPFLSVAHADVHFTTLGGVIHFGEDINGESKIQMAPVV